MAMASVLSKADLDEHLFILNERMPVGAPVVYWTWAAGSGRESRTRSRWTLLPSRDVVVWVEGESSCIGEGFVSERGGCDVE